MTQILQATANNISAPGVPLLATNDKVVVTQREYANIAKGSALGSELTDLGPGILLTAVTNLTALADDDQLVASITPGFPGRVVSAFAIVGTAVSTASRLASVGVFIDELPGVNEVQTLTLTGVPTGGNFILRFPGMTLSDGTVIAAENSGAIAWNAASSAVQTALLAMAAFQTGDVVVTGGVALPTGPHTITFGGKYAGEAVPALEDIAANATSLTGGTAEAAAIVETTPGTEGADEGGGQPVIGGVIALTSANATPSGKVIPATPIRDSVDIDASNHFRDTSVITFRTTANPTDFAEGTVLFGVLVAPSRKGGPVEY